MNDKMLQNKRINNQFFIDNFFVTASGVSTRGNNCAQIFVSDKGFVAIYSMISKGDFPDALHMFCKYVGVLLSNIIDPAGETNSWKVKKFFHQLGAIIHILEENTQWANWSDICVGMFK